MRTKPSWARVHLEAGKPAALHVDYRRRPQGELRRQAGVGRRSTSSRQPEAIEAAKNADVVVAVSASRSELEGEEMQVSEPGFKGGDRTSHRHAQPEEELLEALAATAKPLCWFSPTAARWP